MAIPSYSPVKQTIGALLNNTSPALKVPEYQRDYSWQSKHVTDLWHDLHTFASQEPRGASREYFFGTIVMVNNGSFHLILDGQQRLATTTILLAVIRDRLRRLDPAAADYIQNSFIAFENPLDPGNSKNYKLELNVFDCEYFRRHIQDERDSSATAPRRRSHKAIRDAKARLSSLLDQELEALAEPVQRIKFLKRLSTCLTQQFGVVAITSDDHDHAASIFETLNERGMSLSTADLLRSWILSNAKRAAREEIIQLWEQIGTLTGESRIESVIRTSWIASHGDVKARALYKVIKDELGSQNIDSADYTRSLWHDARFLGDLQRGTTKSEDVNECGKDLVDLKATAGFATILAAFNKLPPREYSYIARAVVSLAVRHNVLAGFDPSRFEGACYECARTIAATSSLEAALEILRAASPTNEEIRSASRRLAFTPQRSKVAQVVLRGIENGRSREKRIGVKTRVHLEHIYPQKPPPERKNRHHEKIVYLLGNLTLLHNKLNQSASNGTFAKKKRAYAQSELQITRDLGEVSKWGVSKIKERQQSLIEEGLRKVWSQNLVAL